MVDPLEKDASVFQRAQLKKRLEKMHEPLKISSPTIVQSKLVQFSKKISKGSQALNTYDSALAIALKSAQQYKLIESSVETTIAASGVAGIGWVLAVFDLTRIPFLYFSAFILNEKIPFTLKNNAKFIYAGVALILGVVSVAVPAAAPVIVLIAASMALAASLITLAKVTDKNISRNIQSNAVEKRLVEKEEQLKEIKATINELSRDLNEASDETILNLVKAMNQFDEYQKQLQKLQDTKGILDHKKQKSGIVKIFDKGVAVALSMAAVIGVIISIYVPPTGVGILLGVAIASAAYLTVKLVGPVIWSFGKKLIQSVKAFVTIEEQQPGSKNEVVMGKEPEHDNELSKKVVKTETQSPVQSKNQFFAHPENNEQVHPSSTSPIANFKE